MRREDDGSVPERIEKNPRTAGGDGAFFEPEVETLSREALRALQLGRLREQVRRCHDSSPFYREKFQAAGFEPGDLRSLDDLASLPIVHKQELRDEQAAHPPFGHYVIAPLSEVRELHPSTGTTGRPVHTLWTFNDAQTIARFTARLLWQAGTRPGDIIQNAFSYGLWIAGLAVHYAADLLRCLVIPIGATLTENRHVPIGVFLKSWDDMVAGKRTGARYAGREERIDPDRPVLGINLAGPAENGGVTLEGVMENSPAQKAGLQAGDVVTEINGDAVNTPQELVRSVSEFKAGEKLTISYQRGDGEEEIEIKLARLGDLLEAPPERPGRERRGQRNRERLREGGEAEPKDDSRKEEPKAEEKPGEDGEKAGQARKEVEKLLRESLRKGNLDLNEKQLEKLGGMAELERVLRELAESIGPEGLRDMLELEIQSGPDDFFESTMKALQPVTGKAARSVVAVQVDGVRGALGTVVSKKGHILTKNTETLKGKISRSGDDKDVPLKLVKRFPKRDLALYQGPPIGLEPVRWIGKKQSPIGTLLTSPDPEGEPLGIGLISVLTRALGEVGFLGIQAGEGDGGVIIERTVNGSPAQEAGLRPDDVITHVDGLALMDPFAFGNKIRTYRAGDEVEFTYRRGEDEEKRSGKS